MRAIVWRSGSGHKGMTWLRYPGWDRIRARNQAPGTLRGADTLRGAKREPSTRSQIIGLRCARDARK